jgi:hypothetical protein
MVINSSGNIGVGQTSPDASAQLEVGDGTDNKGMLIPRVSLISNTDVATITSPATSLMVYNTNASMTNASGTGYYYWDGSKWLSIAMTSNSGGPCAVSELTTELTLTTSAGVPCVGANCDGGDKFLVTCAANCYNLSYNGYTDWRVPSYDELVNLYPIAPNNTQNDFFWTTTSSDGEDATTGVFTNVAELSVLSTVSASQSSSFGCRCVR